MSENLVKLSRGEPRPPAAGGIRITAAAAAEIQRQGERKGMPGAAIRLGIRGGGCSGYSYLFEWEAGEPRERDEVFSEHGVRVFVDPRSLRLLAGTEVDFVRSLSGHGFKFNNPNAKGSCGCGESIQF
ncbi:MAG TPA: iron-sulfur cluster assembly accessory protein [Kofleriaceae bacterium]|nr:iron-sulfur cluster assembly accessory protein [Kofleriaceae bacterium]